MSNLQTNSPSKLYFQNVDQQTGGKWLNNGTKHRNDSQLQSLKLHCGISWLSIQIWLLV